MHDHGHVQIFLEDHNPSRQSKPQYKSAIWTHSPEQEAAVAKALQSYENTRGQKVSLYMSAFGAWPVQLLHQHACIRRLKHAM